MKSLILILVICLVSGQAIVRKQESDREHDGFVGPVKKMVATWTPISGSSYPPGSKCRSRTDEYDRTGRITRHSVYPGSCGSDEIREDYTYSSDGNKSTKLTDIRGENSTPPPPPAVTGPNANLNEGPPKELQKFDDSGRLVEKGLVTRSGRVIYKNVYTYDAKGRLIEITGYEGDDNQRTDRHVYLYSGDERVPSGFMYYRREGKLSQRTSYTDYEFNSKGDWIKRKVSTEETFNRRTVSMVYREIEYYPDNN